jgi:peptidoglycan/LPS O-acetylase OafA/YrhL
MNSENSNARLPGLDGLRGISILLVIMCHSNWTQHIHLRANLAEDLRRATFPLGYFGVPIFFVISGFLITYLLLKEERRHGSISLKQFWVRRFLRIVPPVMAYVLFITIFSKVSGLHLQGLDLASVILFFRNLVDGNAFFDHFWSLSLEEQFYLIWPLVLVFAPRHWRLRIGLVLLILFPLLRLASACFFSPPLHDFLTRMMRFDSILVGCLLAIVWDAVDYLKFPVQWGNKIFLAGLAGAFLAWLLSYHFNVCPNFSGTMPLYKQLMEEIMTVLLNLGISCIIISAVTQSSQWAAFLNMKWLVCIGVISYSLYLWQQFFFFAPNLPNFMYYLPVRVLFSFGVATCAYFLIERPLAIYRRRNQQNRTTSETATAKAALNPG